MTNVVGLLYLLTQ